MTDQLEPLLRSWPGVLCLRALVRSVKGYILTPANIAPLVASTCEKGGHVWIDQPPEGPGEGRRVYVMTEAYEEERELVTRLAKAGFVAWGFYNRILPWQMATYWASQGRPPEKGPTEVKFAMLGLSRTGSTYLSTILQNAGFGSPCEHYSMETRRVYLAGMSMMAFLKSAERASQQQVFSTKILLPYFFQAAGLGAPAIEAHVQKMKDAGYVLFRLTRDPIQGVVSQVIAEATTSWIVHDHRLERVRERQQEVEIGDQHILDTLVSRTTFEILADRFLDVPEDRCIDYLRLEQDPAGVVEGVSRAIGRTPVEDASLSSPMSKLSKDNPAYDRWSQRTRELLGEQMGALQTKVIHALQFLTGVGGPELRDWPELRHQMEKVMASSRVEA